MLLYCLYNLYNFVVFLDLSLHFVCSWNLYFFLISSLFYNFLQNISFFLSVSRNHLLYLRYFSLIGFCILFLLFILSYFKDFLLSCQLFLSLFIFRYHFFYFLLFLKCSLTFSIFFVLYFFSDLLHIFAGLPWKRLRCLWKSLTLIVFWSSLLHHCIQLVLALFFHSLLSLTFRLRFVVSK